VKMVKMSLGVALVVALALGANGCCPGCYVLKKAYQAITGTGGDSASCHASSGTPATKAQTTCPVLGGKVDRQLYVDHEGKRIYVCCAGCLDAVRKDPAKYVRQLEASGVTLERVPAATP